MRLTRFFGRRLVARAFRRHAVWPIAHVYEDDVFLVGYPKSGNTWLRFLIANYLRDEEVDFLSIENVIPGVFESPKACNSLARPRVMHGHFVRAAFDSALSKRRGSPKVVFIVRDGRDVAVSYYHHAIKHRTISPDTSFREFLESFNRGEFHPHVPWGQYVGEWARQPSDGFQIYIVQYELLLKDTACELRSILEFLGRPIDARQVSKAIDCSSFSAMKDHEKRQALLHQSLRTSDISMPFVRKGIAGEWKHWFGRHEENEFKAVHSEGGQYLLANSDE